LISSLSRASYGIYLIHYILIAIVSLIIPKIIKHTALKWIPFLLCTIIIVSWGLILLTSKIPYIKKLSGYH